MVDGRGNLWVTDFGLAQMHGDHGLTQTGDLVGTFRYMSPEQAGGRPGRPGVGRRPRAAADDPSGDADAAPVVLDPRTDVYSLGVTLYELLTLQPALPGRTRDDLLVQLAAVDPKPPRTIDRAIPIELQTILAKCYAKDPADRYPSARAVADDLGRFLADEPIHARPPTVWDRAAKWTRRHRSVALSAIVVLTLAAAGLGATTLVVSAEQGRTRTAFERARAGEAEALRQGAEANRQRAQAVANFRQAFGAVDALTGVATDQLPNIEPTSAVRRSLLTTALTYYRGLEAANRGDPAVAASLARAERQATVLYNDLVATDARYRARYDLYLLTRPAVQKDVALSAGQVRRADDLQDAAGWGFGWRHDAGDTGKGGGPATHPRASLADLLRPSQLARLEQISRQRRGIRAFDDPEVQAVLQLTAEQANRVLQIRVGAAKRELSLDRRDVTGDHGGDHADGPGGDGGMPPDGFDGVPGGGHRDGGPGGDHGGPSDMMMDHEEPGSAAAVQQVFDQVLTVRQQAAWAGLIGQPSTEATSRPFGHRHRGGFGGPFGG